MAAGQWNIKELIDDPILQGTTLSMNYAKNIQGELAEYGLPLQL